MSSPYEAHFFCAKITWLKYSLETAFDKIATCKQAKLMEGAMPPNNFLTHSMKRRQTRIPLAFSRVTLFLMIQFPTLYYKHFRAISNFQSSAYAISSIFRCNLLRSQTSVKLLSILKWETTSVFFAEIMNAVNQARKKRWSRDKFDFCICENMLHL